MTTEEKAVIEAAEAWACADTSHGPELQRILAAVDRLLEAERKSTDRMTPEEKAAAPLLEDLLTDLFESAQMAEYDFCGEQRAWHWPRLSRAMRGMLELFPADAARALEKAKTPYQC